jgi:tetratricopeptide (TPR) repeat protein
MTDELITALARNRSLRVVSRTSAMQYKGVNKPLRDMAQALGVDGILEGSVNRSGNRVHINLQLIYAPTDTHIWAESYDRDVSAALSLPEELSQTIAAEAKVEAVPARPQRVINPEAHDAYLQGRYFWFEHNFPRSQEYLEKAIQLQPDYAAAWCGLGDTYGAWAVARGIPPQEAFAKLEDATKKALQLDDSLPEAHDSMAALYLFNKWDWRRAEAESVRAIGLNPNYAEARFTYTYVLTVLNRNDEALQEQKRSSQITPFERPWALGLLYLHLRQYDAAITELRLQTEAEPNNAWVRYLLSEAYWLKGLWKESEQELEKGHLAIGNARMAEASHRAFERGGEKAVEQLEVRSILERARKQYVSPIDVARQYAMLGDKEETLTYLEAAYRERSPWLVFLQKEPVFDFLHADGRYRKLVKEIGLPTAD